MSSNRRPAELQLLRYVPVPSPVHGLWAGTKLVALGGASLTLSIRPTWEAQAVIGAAVVGALLLARIPRGATPRLPRWLWIGLAISQLLALWSGGPPQLDVLGVGVQVGGLLTATRFLVLTAILILAALVVGWTTPQAELAPALARLGRPLRRLRVPVDELATAVALGVRCLPLLSGELRTMRAAARARGATGRRGAGRWAFLPDDLMAGALVMAVRHAGEMAQAMEARGGAGGVSAAPARLGRNDAVALILTAVVVAVALVL